MKEVVIGVDIGGTFTKYGIVDRGGVVIKSGFISTDVFPELEEYLRNLSEAINLELTAEKDTILKGIGIGAPNGNYYKGTIENAANLNWKGIVPFVERFKRYYKNIPIVLTNDANAAAIGEVIYGGAKGMKDFIVITLGTGLGSGIVVNGKLVYGHDGHAGELGHINVVPNGRDCGCGRKGCLETYVSATGIKRTVFQLLSERTVDSEFQKISFDDLTAKMIAEAATRNDLIALEAFELCGKNLGEMLAEAVHHTSPEAIFLSGGLANAGDLILKPAKKYMEANLLPIFRNKVKIMISAVQETNAAVLGASALAWNEIKNPD